MTVAAYIRVSSRSQNAATQRDAIARAVDARGDTIDRWFAEKRSAAKLQRPGLDELREQVRTGNIRTLYVFRLDRLARSGIRDTMSLLEELRKGGCRVLSVADGFDLEGPAADVVIAVMAWAAQMERLALGERIAAARARVEARGGAWGRPKRLDAGHVNKIRGLARLGHSIRKIAVHVKVPRATVGDVLSEKGAYAAAKKTTAKRASKRRKPPSSG